MPYYSDYECGDYDPDSDLIDGVGFADPGGNFSTESGDSK